MSVPTRATVAAAPASAVPPATRALAARLSALFTADSEIVVALNDAHSRLADANDRLWTDRAVDPIWVHEQIHQAFYAYQQASEQRRQLGFDVGELSQQLTDALRAAGYSPQQAQAASVHELAAGVWQPTQGKETNQ